MYILRITDLKTFTSYSVKWGVIFSDWWIWELSIGVPRREGTIFGSRYCQYIRDINVDNYKILHCNNLALEKWRRKESTSRLWTAKGLAKHIWWRRQGSKWWTWWLYSPSLWEFGWLLLWYWMWWQLFSLNLNQ